MNTRYTQILLYLIFTFNILGQKIPKKLTEKDMGGYLMVYFKDDTHDLYFATSRDGYSFTDINNGKPIMAGDTIAEQKGIRDPHIMRGPDGWFYAALTDLHIYAKKEGYRTTEWERDRKEYGWGNNRGMVLLKSPDLIHWSHTVLRVDKAFPQFENIGCAWAPELIYDEQQHKIMIYFTMRLGVGKEKVYYAYMNKDFTALESMPKVLFEYPNDKPYIDGDITKVGNKYHLFYCLHDGKTAGIKQATSDLLTSGYTFDSTWIDPETVSCEAPNIFKRIKENKWVLIYDIYQINPHNFGFSETSDFIHFKNLGHFNEGVMKATNFSIPKHPSVIQVTKQEIKNLERYWNKQRK